MKVMQWMMSFVLLFAVLKAHALEGDYLRDEHGRLFRVRFDPRDRWTWGMGWSLENKSDSAWYVMHSIDLSTHFQWGKDKSHIDWFLEQRLLSFNFQPLSMFSEFRLYQLHFLRHSADPHFVLPSIPPKKMPFPFDVGIAFHAGSWKHVENLEEVIPGEAWIFLDPWRSGRDGDLFGIGIGISDRLHLLPSSYEVQAHWVAPFTDLILRGRLEHSHGLGYVELWMRYAHCWEIQQEVWDEYFEFSLHGERILWAINDLPMGMAFDFSDQWEKGKNTWLVGLSLQLWMPWNKGQLPPPKPKKSSISR